MSSTPISQSARQRAPLFYCYECHAEMRPLMVPDPHCASCNSTFVEEIPSTSDSADTQTPNDPRSFQEDPFQFLDQGDHDHAHMGPHVHVLGGGSNGGMFGPPFGGDPIVHLMNMMMTGYGGGPGAPQRLGGGSTVRFDMRNGRGRVVFTSSGGGGPSPLADIIPGPAGARPSGPGSRSPGTPGGMPPGHPLEGIFALLGGGLGLGPMGGMPAGQYGDYVLDQATLDEVVTRLMEQGQGSRPVPAPDDMIAKLPREVVEANSPLLEKECAVCKDSFEPSGDQKVVTLPCHHAFHEDCIVPWLKQSGTCPVCRHQLVPQPEHHSQGPQSPGANPHGGPSSQGGPQDAGSSSSPTAAISGIWNMLTGAASRAAGQPSSSGSNNQQSQQRPSFSQTNPTNNPPPTNPNTRPNNSSPRPGPQNPPGSWEPLD